MSKDWEEKFRPEDLQRIRGFRLMDDDFMSKCFEENIECTELVLQIVLGRDDLKVEKVAIQHQLKNLQGRSIIFDIYATDHAGKRYNVEIQRADRGAGAKRARYHSSLIDANVTEPGEKLENLVETYVIFITEHDVLGKGKPIYHIDRVIKETGENFGDEAHILYVVTWQAVRNSAFLTAQCATASSIRIKLWLLWAEEILHLVTHFIFQSLQKLFTLSTDVTSSEQIKLCRKRSLKQIISCLL